MRFTPAGVLAGDGQIGQDLDVLREAGVEAVKLRAGVNPAESIRRLREAGIHTCLVQLLSPSPGDHPTSPADFVAEFEPAVEAFLRAGVTDFEIHGEPNVQSRGFGVSWDSPAAFSDWFLAVADILRSSFGPPLRVGFPGLAPPPPLPPGITPAIPDDLFLDGCENGLAGADLVCCHTYWDSRDQMRD